MAKDISLNTLSKISANTIVKGDIISEGDFRIDGVLEGNIVSKSKIIVGIKGNLKGDVSCESLETEGIIEGKVKIKDILSLKSTSRIEGEVQTNRIIVDNGAMLNATCTMSYQKKQGDREDDVELLIKHKNKKR